MSAKRQLGPEVLFEFRPNGAYCKVSAIDPETGLEAVIVGASASGQMQLKLIALKKLQALYDRHYGEETAVAPAKTRRRDGSIIA